MIPLTTFDEGVRYFNYLTIASVQTFSGPQSEFQGMTMVCQAGNYTLVREPVEHVLDKLNEWLTR